jgi:hypothetical protein
MQLGRYVTNSTGFSQPNHAPGLCAPVENMFAYMNRAVGAVWLYNVGTGLYAGSCRWSSEAVLSQPINPRHHHRGKFIHNDQARKRSTEHFVMLQGSCRGMHLASLAVTGTAVTRRFTRHCAARPCQLAIEAKLCYASSTSLLHAVLRGTSLSTHEK